MGIVPRPVGCLIVAPVPTNPFTGGHLVNDRLSVDPRVALLHVDSLGEAVATIRSRFAENEGPSVVIDSLFLTDPAGIRTLADSVETPIGLLAHSLPSILPGGPVAERREWLEAESASLDSFGFAIAPSVFMERALIRRGFQSRIERVTPAPIVDGRLVARARAGDKSAESGRPIRILTIANWTPSKGIDRAWTVLQEMGELAWEWLIVGRWDGSDYSKRLRAEILKSPLAARVTIRSPADPEANRGAYESADIFLLPSSMESYGLVFAEAITHGLPVVACSAAAIPEVLGTAALLTGPGDQAGLVSGLRHLISDSHKRRILSERAVVQAGTLPVWPLVRDHFVAAVNTAGVTQFAANHAAGGCPQCG